MSSDISNLRIHLHTLLPVLVDLDRKRQSTKEPHFVIVGAEQRVRYLPAFRTSLQPLQSLLNVPDPLRRSRHIQAFHKL